MARDKVLKVLREGMCVPPPGVNVRARQVGAREWSAESRCFRAAAGYPRVDLRRGREGPVTGVIFEPKSEDYCGTS
jgi:hypothetical protein